MPNWLFEYNHLLIGISLILGMYNVCFEYLTKIWHGMNNLIFNNGYGFLKNEMIISKNDKKKEYQNKIKCNIVWFDKFICNRRTRL